VTVTIIGGLDIHRAQLTYEYVDVDTGEVSTGRVEPADRKRLRRRLERFAEVTDPRETGEDPQPKARTEQERDAPPPSEERRPQRDRDRPRITMVLWRTLTGPSRLALRAASGRP
jgi:hypothetical protein